MQWAFWDVMPTLAELAGASKHVPKGIDGVSISDFLLRGTLPSAHRSFIFTWDGTGVARKGKAAEKEASIPLPAEWVAQENALGLLEYLHITSGSVSSSHPVTGESAARGKGSVAGYSIRTGDYKGVVAHCADASSLKPSSEDKFEVYNLREDPFEMNDIAGTAAGKAQIEGFLDVLRAQNVTCKCYQC